MLYLVIFAVLAWCVIAGIKSKSKPKPVEKKPAGPAPVAPESIEKPQKEVDPRWTELPAEPENGLRAEDYLSSLKVQQDERTAQNAHYSFVVLNMETTGLDGNEEDILQVVILDPDGKELLNQKCKPTKVKKWEDAAEVNEIWPKDVAFCPTFEQIAPYVQDVLSRATKIVAFSRQYKQWFLEAHGIEPRQFKWAKDPQKMALQYYNLCKGTNRSRWIELEKIASMTGYKGGLESCSERAQASLYIYRFLEDWTKRQREEAKERAKEANG